MSFVAPQKHVDKSDLRADFAAAMSAMYKAEVPLYADLIEIVQDINQSLISCSSLASNLERLTTERHGAIRLGTAHELHTIQRIFKLLDMHPVGYYDLSVAGLPMHATAFRPTSVASLEKNPFRVFTTLLRPELLASARARALAKALLARRNIFSDALVRMLDTADSQDGQLTDAQAKVFVGEALRTFSWQPVAASTDREYEILKAEHPILADIACFKTAHINHLTPRTLNISRAQRTMVERGMRAKERIEGPPPRACPILLRQTSFLALEEQVSFYTDADAGSLVPSTHTARFGEIEQRGAALTPTGRDLYDALLAESAAQSSAGLGPAAADAAAKQVFAAFPDTWESLRGQDLIYCRYAVVKRLERKPAFTGAHKTLLDQLVADGCVEAVPITYEDFLTFSAAGIFRSNLSSASSSEDDLSAQKGGPDQAGLESALGAPLLDIYEWYDGVQRASLEAVGRELGVDLTELTI
ncbi:hypothetical protein LMH87_000316 [Akanthomyces muscarius]|uniref:2-oxoadipate dioxygenase/decarboxylase n=1 Tax=Akanthomyces muscarius TaxID=2231603 RepID=A0A9W8QES3_AKAMU|nr:hypothetical protein LMH87_000316 [Akanthomyces muscarius]KAJ4155050.1 hypothetical protein LMH87_000316 [Akanthomyces muscarius]